MQVEDEIASTAVSRFIPISSWVSDERLQTHRHVNMLFPQMPVRIAPARSDARPRHNVGLSPNAMAHPTATARLQSAVHLVPAQIRDRRAEHKLGVSRMCEHVTSRLRPSN